MRNRYTFDTYHSAQTSQKSGSPTNSYENVISDQIMASQAEGNNKANQIFVDTPFASYKGHTSDLLDVSWSKVCNTILEIWLLKTIILGKPQVFKYIFSLKIFRITLF